MINAETPYFLKIRGCINCNASKKHKEKTGFDYGFDHELIALCLVMDCFYHGHDLTNPYYDPEELVRIANKLNDSRAYEKAREMCRELENRFGDSYKKEGISITTILQNLNDKES